ncbi:hypothetical protein NQ318_020650 [Aromia moschata]|uniref:RNA-directed DNA polymerase n=1 Tax=Aromia moschata TaxID=1265417 RepID=A0AAV8XE37_9CUCU|nr:hypothetical protein NQ318_020650 [Aromia moschata]
MQQKVFQSDVNCASQTTDDNLKTLVKEDKVRTKEEQWKDKGRIKGGQMKNKEDKRKAKGDKAGQNEEKWILRRTMKLRSTEVVEKNIVYVCSFTIEIPLHSTREIKQRVKEGNAEKMYLLEDNKLCRLVNGQPKIVIPKDVRWRVTRLQHDENGHPGLYRTLEALKEKYWFTDMRKFVTKYVKRCIPYHLGPFCKTPEGNTFMLVTVDAFTKFTWIEAVPDTSSQYITKTLDLLIKIFGVPERIITDRGKGFTSKVMAEFCRNNNIRHIQNAIACPRANGQVERFNSTILRAMTAAVGENYDAWESKIPEVQCGINGTVNSTTGKSPAELLYGFRPRLKYDININTQTDRLGNLDLARQSAAMNIVNKAKLMKKNFDKKRLEPIQYNVGDMVLVERTPMIKGLSSGKLVQKFTGPVQVTHVLGNDRYRVQSLSRDKRRFKGVVASDRLKLFKIQKNQ